MESDILIKGLEWKSGEQIQTRKSVVKTAYLISYQLFSSPGFRPTGVVSPSSFPPPLWSPSYCMISSLTSRAKVFRNCWVHQCTSGSRDAAPATAIFPNRNQLGCKSVSSCTGLVPFATETSTTRVPRACTAPLGRAAFEAHPAHLHRLWLLSASGRSYPCVGPPRLSDSST